MKNKIITLVILSVLIFSGCSVGKNSAKNNTATQISKNNSAQQSNEQLKSDALESETLNEDEDKIPFKDPGDDEVGKEIKEMDNLINQTDPSEYESDSLTDESLETEVETY